MHDDDTNALTLDVPDEDLLTLLKKPISESKSYWDNSFGLRKAREDNMRYWLPKHWEMYGTDVYDYQEDSQYQNNRIFTSLETVISTVNARAPGIEVMPAQDTLVSLQMAKDLQKTCDAYISKNGIIDMFRLSTRNLLIKRGCFLKLRWDRNRGQKGEIVTEIVQLEDTIVDKDAKMGEIPRFMGHRLRGYTAEEIISILPDSEQKVFELLGCKRKDKQGNLVAYQGQLGKKVEIIEVWFRYYKKGELFSGVCWVDENCSMILDKDRNPNWNYEEGEGRSANFLDEPAPPFIPINHLNDGESYFDQTTLIEEAAPLQRILDKRGFQIMDNADQAGSGLVFNTQMIGKSDIEKLTGSPDERIGVKGDVRSAVARVAPPPLPAYVIQDKIDARNEIDNIFGTHDVSRGERGNNQTLGQDLLQHRQDMTRFDDIARAVERQATGYLRYLVQMMKVYYTEDHYYKAVGEDGQFDFIVMRSDLIENGIDIRVAAGSMMPVDKIGQQKWVGDLAKMGMIDPLTVFEVAAGGNLPEPKKMLERYMTFKTDPLRFMGDIKEDEFSRDAYMDVQVLNEGTMPDIRDEYTPTYLNFMNNYMIGGEFEKQPALVKQMYLEHINIVRDIINRQLSKLMTQMPTKEEMMLQNQQTMQDQQMMSQMEGGAPQPGKPNKGPVGPDQKNPASQPSQQKSSTPVA